MESDLDRVRALVQARATALEKSKLTPRTPPTPEEVAASAMLLQRDIDELALVRVGAAQGARKRLGEIMARLRQTTDADRQSPLQLSALEALTYLGDAMQRNGDRSAGHPLPPKTVPIDPAGPNGEGGLPTRSDADAARDLARRQRAIRDDATRAAVELTRGVRPASGDPLSGLVHEQQKLAEEIRKHAGASVAAEAADRVSHAVRFGAIADARERSKEALRLLHSLGTSELSERQSKLSEQITAAEDDFAGQAARQKNELAELSRQCVSIAAKLDQAVLRVRGSRFNVDVERLSRAAETLRRASGAIAAANREADAGRSAAANETRRRAAEAFTEAVNMIASAVPMPDSGDTISRAAVLDIQRAEAALRSADPSAVKSAVAAVEGAITKIKTGVRVITGP